MAHIVDCMAGAEPSFSISKPASPCPPVMDLRTPPTTTNDKPFVWRMQQQSQPSDQPRRYQLFPRERQLPVLNSSKTSDTEKATTAMANAKEEKLDKMTTATSLKNKITQHSLVRRRKISVPELGPMTTVQEVPMDSPTIPGRPPLHERSVSAPGGDRHPAVPRSLMIHNNIHESEIDPLDAAIEDSFLSFATPRPLSPKLAPLVIPLSNSRRPPQLLPRRPITHLRSGSAPDETPRTGRFASSPYSRSALTPQSSTTDLTTPRTASTNPLSSASLQTPISAPALESNHFSPKTWEPRANTPTLTERSMTPQPTASQSMGTTNSHRRGTSESSTIMDRGRPRKRSDSRNNNGSQLKQREASEVSSEWKAFEDLPSGALPKEVLAKMEAEEIKTIQKQAYRQAERFEVLRAEEVEALSKELRRLDERTEYLRRTYTSLRAGRRNLHSRICQFLRSARVARFSYESMLKQEEALAELDASIDDWVNKIEKAENRRTRLRQKLLEHVAAAAILPTGSTFTPSASSPEQTSASQRLSGVFDISTPPRSPSKQGSFSSRASSCSPSPQRVVAQVPSTILENPIVEEAEAMVDDQSTPGPAALNRADVESIRIYAGDDIYTLLADVENEITRMSANTPDFSPQEMGDFQRKALHRARSHEMLNGLTVSVNTESQAAKEPITRSPESPPAPTPPMKDFPPGISSAVPVEEVMLSKAVFVP